MYPLGIGVEYYFVSLKSQSLAYINVITRYIQTISYFSDFVQPICLPSPFDEFPESSTCLISGWGATNRSQGKYGT